MVGRKRRSGVWHHRVPDFKLVYCGPNGHVPKKGTKLTIIERSVKVSFNADERRCCMQEIGTTEDTRTINL